MDIVATYAERGCRNVSMRVAAGSLQRRLLPAVLKSPGQDMGETSGSECKPLARAPNGFKWEVSSHCRVKCSAVGLNVAFTHLDPPGSAEFVYLICVSWGGAGLCPFSPFVLHILECKAC